MSVFFKLDPTKLAEALESIGWSGGGGGDASIAYSATAPIAPSNGDLWYDTANTKLKLYSGGLWVSMSLSQAEYNSIIGVISTLSESLANADASATKAEEEATLAENAKDAILGMQVATGVAGSSVTWNGTTLTVPQGVQGIKGDSVTDVSSSKVGKTTTVNVYVEGALENAFTVLDGTDGEVSTAQLNTAIAGITKTSLGLANVDNTSDADKPVSTAQATAIALKADTGHSHTALTGLTVTGLKETSVAMAANDIDLATGNLFTKTISGATTLTVSNVPASGTVGYFILKLTNGGAGAVTYPSGTKWSKGTAPTLTASGIDLLRFVTIDGGVRFEASRIQEDSK